MKKELRQQTIARLKNIPQATHASTSEQIVERLLQTPAFLVANTIAVTMSNYPEVETRGLIQKAWAFGKKIVVPKSHPATREMTFYCITNFSQLEVAYANIEEPIEAVCDKVSIEEIDLVIVPGVVFTKQGYRIGFGGGYYDRFLSRYEGQTIALAFEEQLAASIPIDAHDIAVQQILTNERLIQCSEE